MTSSTKAADEDLVVLNVSGLKYQLEKRVLHKFPGALLDSLMSAYGTNYNVNNNDNLDENGRNLSGDNGDLSKKFHWTTDKQKRNDYVFVQRSPQMFELIVLQTYVTGKLHVPKWMCPQSVLEELKFWRLDVENACACCSGEEQDQDGSDTSSNKTNHKSLENPSYANQWEKFRRKAWDMCDKPSTSIAATIFGVVSLMFVFLSCAVFVAGSFKSAVLCTSTPVIANENVNITNNFSYVNTTPPALYANFLISNSSVGTVTDDKASPRDDYSNDIESPVFFSACGTIQILQILEMTCIVWFTLELVVRLIFCPNVVQFFKHPLNIIDILATVPYYVEIILALLEYNNPSVKRVHGIFVLIRVLRCLRVFRILKLARYFEELRILGKTLKAAKDELCMLGLFVFIAVFIFSSVMYQLEKDEVDTQYTSIPASCWWGIVTLTTVGYGDISPKTIYGKVFAAVACVAGIIITAFPVSILVEHFTLAYKNKTHPMFQIRRKTQQKTATIDANSAGKVDNRKVVSI